MQYYFPASPDQPWNPRLQLLSELGLGWAAAVPFNLHGDQGIVVYCARNGVDMDRLQSDDNESYLIAATDLIGSAYALRGELYCGMERGHQSKVKADVVNLNKTRVPAHSHISL